MPEVPAVRDPRGLMARLLEKYRTEIVPELKSALSRDNVLALPLRRAA